MTVKWLCLIFGITPSPCSRILRKILCMTVKQLRFHPLACIKFPDEQKMQHFAEMISTREPTISNVIRFMDGLGLATEMTDKRIEQNAYYYGYDCDTMVNNVLVFGPDGKVFFCAINYRKNAGIFLSVLFWFTIFELRSLVLIRFLWCLRRSTSKLLTYMVTIGFADITLSLAIARLTMKQSCWRRTLVTMKKMKMNFNIWGLVTKGKTSVGRI
jgi:hypothetical protein